MENNESDIHINLLISLLNSDKHLGVGIEGETYAALNNLERRYLDGETGYSDLDQFVETSALNEIQKKTLLTWVQNYIQYTYYPSVTTKFSIRFANQINAHLADTDDIDLGELGMYYAMRRFINRKWYVEWKERLDELRSLKNTPAHGTTTGALEGILEEKSLHPKSILEARGIDIMSGEHLYTKRQSEPQVFLGSAMMATRGLSYTRPRWFNERPLEIVFDMQKLNDYLSSVNHRELINTPDSTFGFGVQASIPLNTGIVSSIITTSDILESIKQKFSNLGITSFLPLQLVDMHQIMSAYCEEHRIEFKDAIDILNQQIEA